MSTEWQHSILVMRDFYERQGLMGRAATRALDRHAIMIPYGFSWAA